MLLSGIRDQLYLLIWYDSIR